MFHISGHDLGKFVTLIPGVPRTPAKGECSTTPRVCFAPTVEQCLIGLVGFGHSNKLTFMVAFFSLINCKALTVYYTDDDLQPAHAVSDHLQTEEHWSLYPIEAERIGYVDRNALIRDRIVDVVDDIRPIMLDPLIFVSQSEKELLIRMLDSSV